MTLPYKEVRGLTRGLELLRALNRMPGGMASTSELASRCGLHRTTAKRLLETLRIDGLVRTGETDGWYGLTFEVRRLAEGFEDEAWVAQVATPVMRSFVPELHWPSDLATIEAGFMVVRESTHRWSNLSQHRAMIGERMPVFVTALGRAYLSACSDEELEALLALLGRRGDWIGEFARRRAAVRRLVADVRRRGHAVNAGEWVQDPHFSAIAVPVFAGQRLLGAVNMVFPNDAVPKQDLREKYLPRLVKQAELIGKNSRAWIES